jgi:Rod binding domain-containing protein
MQNTIYRYFPFLQQNNINKNETSNNILEKLEGRISSSKIQFNQFDKEKIEKSPEKKKLYEVSLEFQSLFIKMMLNSMRKTLSKENDLLYGGRVQEIFEDMLYDEYAKIYSKNADLPLAKEIYFQLEKFVEDNPKEKIKEMENTINQQKSYIKQIEGLISTEQIQNEWYR